MRQLAIYIMTVQLLVAGALSAEGDPVATAGDVEAWARVLVAYERGGGVDYAGLAADRQDLDRYLASLASARPERLSREGRLALWSNAYNAVVLHHVLERYPGIASVLDQEGFFKSLVFPVAGLSLTLDEIETRARELGDPRVHFAVVCASTSCPDLLGEPYRAAILEAQLAAQTRRFLDDPTKGMRFDAGANQLRLSSIFEWYAGDFTGNGSSAGLSAPGAVTDWVLSQLPAERAAELEKRAPEIRYLDYDWTLNDRPGG